MPGAAAAIGAPHGPGAWTVAQPLANIASIDVFPAQAGGSASDALDERWQLRPPLGTSGRSMGRPGTRGYRLVGTIWPQALVAQGIEHRFPNKAISIAGTATRCEKPCGHRAPLAHSLDARSR